MLDWEVAHSDGVVTATRNDCMGFEAGSYGNYVMLRHGNGYYTMYAHMAYGTVQVRAGQTVKKGQVLGYIQKITSEYASNTRLVDVQNQLVETNASIETANGTIQSVASALELTNGNVSALQTIVQQDATQIQAVVEQNNNIALVFRITANGVEIGKQDDPVYSRQTNNAYQFVDSSGNKVLLEINTLGIQAPTATVEEQVAFLAGSTPQWAIRKGEVDSNGHYNLNDIWIGG